MPRILITVCQLLCWVSAMTILGGADRVDAMSNPIGEIPKESETFRREMLRHLKDKYGKSKPSVVVVAAEIIAKFSEEEAHARKAIARLGSRLPEPNFCPECYYLHGRHSLLRPISSESDHVDSFRCSVCDFLQTRTRNRFQGTPPPRPSRRRRLNSVRHNPLRKVSD
jgi:hypothetical protein